MAFPNVLRAAKQHYKTVMSGPVAVVTVPEWTDESGAAITLHVFRISGDDAQAVSEARRDWGERGGAAMTVARACFVFDGADKKRAFADTDLPELLRVVDFDVIERLYGDIVQAYSGER